MSQPDEAAAVPDDPARTAVIDHTPGQVVLFVHAPPGVRFAPGAFGRQVGKPLKLSLGSGTLTAAQVVAGGDAVALTLELCCAGHNRHCEPPSELCCRQCTEAAHATFPVPHSDGSPCVLLLPPPGGANTGHGHVWERPDGAKARCGGPAICAQCALDAAGEQS
jgi:hypothetical protein